MNPTKLFFKVYGAGLDDARKKALSLYNNARFNLPPAERRALDADFKTEYPVYQEECDRSKKFAFWVALTRIAQDRPLFFLSGMFFSCLLALQWVSRGVIYLLN